MKVRAILRSAIGGVALLTAAAPAFAQKPATVPPYLGVYQPQGVDEIGLWHQDDEDERQLAVSPLVIRDETLNAYVKHVLCETIGEDRCQPVRVYVVREPTFNASMSPNGTLRVLSGLFLRVRNEAELGAILGHEFGHFEKRHTLHHFQSARTGTDLLAWSALLVSLAPSYSSVRSYQNLQVSVYGSLFRHDRDQEREADWLGVAYLNHSSLRPQAFADVWHTVMGEAEASALSRGLRHPDFKAIAFTASHPPDAERLHYFTQLADPNGSNRDDGAARYRAALARWLPLFLDDQIKLNDFGGSDFLIQNLAEEGWTASLWFARGELYRTRGTQRDLVNAVTFYQQAVQLDPALAPAYRGLGLALIKTGHAADGQAALSRYLALSPDARDAQMIKILIAAGASQ